MDILSKDDLARTILAKIEQYKQDVDDLNELCDQLACVFDSESPQFHTMAALTEDFGAHHAALRFGQVSERIAQAVADLRSGINLAKCEA